MSPEIAALADPHHHFCHPCHQEQTARAELAREKHHRRNRRTPDDADRSVIAPAGLLASGWSPEEMETRLGQPDYFTPDGAGNCAFYYHSERVNAALRSARRGRKSRYDRPRTEQPKPGPSAPVQLRMM